MDNLQTLVLKAVAAGTVSHLELSDTIILSAVVPTPHSFLYEDAWEIIDILNEKGWIEEEYRSAFEGGTLWHLTDKGRDALAMQGRLEGGETL